MKKLILLSSLIISFLAEAQSRYNIIYEAQLGQNYAAENYNSGFHLFDFIVSKTTKDKSYVTRAIEGRI